MSVKERNLINQILIELPSNTRLFRCNSGMAWTGEIVSNANNMLILKNAHPFHALPEGTPDLCGWTTVTVTPDMVGKQVAIFTGVEVKTGNLKLSDKQKKFRDIITKMGGIFREVRG